MIGALLAATLAAGAGAPAAFQLYPIPGVYLPAASEASGALIHHDFRAALDPAAEQVFEEKFRAAFPDAAIALDEKNVRRTFAVSFQVVRASEYRVEKPGGLVDLYLPVTGSLYFTGVATGEVLYAQTRTNIHVASLTTPEAASGGPRVRAMFGDAFKDLAADLVSDAKARFNPTAVAATVRGEWKGLAILDAGRDQGLKRDDPLTDEAGNGLVVVSAGPGYALARADLGAFTVGGRFTRITNQTLAEIRRPRVLALVEGAPAGVPGEALLQLFGDALGAAAPFSLIPVNPTYQDVLRTLEAKTSGIRSGLRQRELPGFFVRLRVPAPIDYEAPTNLGHVRRRVVEARAIGELVDPSGRVLFAAVGHDRTEETITHGIAFELQSKREIGVKNALLDLASRFSSELHFEHAALEVTGAGDALTLRDPHGLVSVGTSVRAYRSVGAVPGIAGDVRVPIWEVNVTAVGDGSALAAASLPVVEGAPKPEPGDVVLLDGAAGAGQVTRKRFGPCGKTDNRGAVELPDYGPLSLAVFARGFRAPYYEPGLRARLSDLVSKGSGFKEDLRVSEPSVDYCVEPVYRVLPAEESCDGEVCADVADLAVTYRIRAGGPTGEIKAREGLRAKATGAALPQATSPASRSAARGANLLEHALSFDSQVATKLSEAQY